MTVDESMKLDALCKVAHEAYEQEAARCGWQTNPASRVAWEDVPEQNKIAMRAALSAALEAQTAEIEKLRAFKAYVHQRLDEAGVPIDPESPHRAAGCRIGGRLDVLIGLRDAQRKRAATVDEIMILADKYAEDHWARFEQQSEHIDLAARDKLRAALEAQAARIAELEKDNAELRERERRPRAFDPLANHLRERIEELEGRLQRAEAMMHSHAPL